MHSVSALKASSHKVSLELSTMRCFCVCKVKKSGECLLALFTIRIHFNEQCNVLLNIKDVTSLQLLLLLLLVRFMSFIRIKNVQFFNIHIEKRKTGTFLDITRIEWV